MHGRGGDALVGADVLLETISGYSFPWLVYFLAYARKAEELGIDLCKGICLTAPIGCGKTMLMNLMRLIPGPDTSFTIKLVHDAIFEFIQDGCYTIDRYSRQSVHAHRPRTVFALMTWGWTRR